MRLPRLTIGRAMLAVAGVTLLVGGTFEGDRLLRRRAIYLDRAGSADIQAESYRKSAADHDGLAADARARKRRGEPIGPAYIDQGYKTWDERIDWAALRAAKFEELARSRDALAYSYRQVARRPWTVEDPPPP